MRLFEKKCINSADYGVPQRRKRVFIIGNNLGIDIFSPKITHSNDSNNKTKKWVSSFNAISDLGSPTFNGISFYKKEPDCEYQKIMRKKTKDIFNLHFIPHVSKKEQEMINYVKQGGNYKDIPDNIATTRIIKFKKTEGRTTVFGRLNPNLPAHTICTYFNKPGIGCNIHYKYNRVFTIREGLRFQSFPDNFNIISLNKRNYYKQIGNAVPPLLNQAWAKQIKTILKNY